MGSTNRRRRAGALIAAASAVAAMLGTAGVAVADTPQVGLPPDTGAYCITHRPFETQQREAGWVVAFDRVQGTAGTNNWACHYLVKAGDAAPFPVPHTVRVDFRTLCAWMYPGAGSDWSTARRDWTCLGKPGRVYTSQRPDGTMNYRDR